MMKTLLILALTLILVGCREEPTKAEAEQQQIQQQKQWQRYSQRAIDRAYVVTKDGCQYLIHNSGTSFMGHKGDCTNPIHTCK